MRYLTVSCGKINPIKEAHVPNSACIDPLERAGGDGHGWMRVVMAGNVGFLTGSAGSLFVGQRHVCQTVHASFQLNARLQTETVGCGWMWIAMENLCRNLSICSTSTSHEPAILS